MQPLQDHQPGISRQVASLFLCTALVLTGLGSAAIPVSAADDDDDDGEDAKIEEAAPTIEASAELRAVLQAEAENDADIMFSSAKDLTRAFPKSALAWYYLGTAELLRGEPRRAVSAFRKSLKLDPSDAARRAMYQ